MNIPENLWYTKDHEWILVEGKTGKVGITDYAQHQLGDVVFVELPSAGKFVAKGGVLATVESVKAVSDVYAPLSGTVTRTNANLETNPEKVNSDPYNEGWIVELEISSPEELSTLYDAKAYEKLLKEAGD